MVLLLREAGRLRGRGPAPARGFCACPLAGASARAADAPGSGLGRVACPVCGPAEAQGSVAKKRMSDAVFQTKWTHVGLLLASACILFFFPSLGHSSFGPRIHLIHVERRVSR